MTRGDWLVDKGTDLFVVVFGILAALSVDSWRDSVKSQKQWESYASHFRLEVNQQGESYRDLLDFYRQRRTECEKYIKILEDGTKDVGDLKKFIQSLAEAKVTFPEASLFQALVRSGNSQLLRDTEKVRWMSKFFYFEKVAMIKVKTFSDHFVPEYKIVTQKYAKYPNSPHEIKDDLLYLLGLAKSIYEDFIRTYEEQDEAREKVLQLLQD